jgi:hypothetical protein
MTLNSGRRMGIALWHYYFNYRPSICFGRHYITLFFFIVYTYGLVINCTRHGHNENSRGHTVATKMLRNHEDGTKSHQIIIDKTSGRHHSH